MLGRMYYAYIYNNNELENNVNKNDLKNSDAHICLGDVENYRATLDINIKKGDHIRVIEYDCKNKIVHNFKVVNILNDYEVLLKYI